MSGDQFLTRGRTFLRVGVFHLASSSLRTSLFVIAMTAAALMLLGSCGQGGANSKSADGLNLCELGGEWSLFPPASTNTPVPETYNIENTVYSVGCVFGDFKSGNDALYAGLTRWKSTADATAEFDKYVKKFTELYSLNVDGAGAMRTIVGTNGDDVVAVAQQGSLIVLGREVAAGTLEDFKGTPYNPKGDQLLGFLREIAKSPAVTSAGQ
ncbi:MAG: hypothetical protein JST64_14255 [Actinobacteria bacterium]|nr:hypothetical protein [Actinomycetota bacterium]